jgi:hypothetical protein
MTTTLAEAAKEEALGYQADGRGLEAMSRAAECARAAGARSR